MEDRLQKRAIMFYVAGVVNLFLGLYVLIEGKRFMDPETANWLVLFFLVFAVVDFWFPKMMRKRMLEEQAKFSASRQGAGEPKR
jgi:uncharacterized membrane protein